MQAVKLDLKKEMSRFYRPPIGRVEVVDMPRLSFIMVDGRGDPSSAGFQEGIQAVYSIAYTLKFSIKKTQGKDYPIMPLEGLWWMKGGGFDARKRDEWLWTLMVVQPEIVTRVAFERAVEDASRKKVIPGLRLARLEEFEEGRCVQSMHVGPYSTEALTIGKMEEFAKEEGYLLTGKHHEIYLGDPRRSAPSKLRTILRHPVAKKPS